MKPGTRASLHPEPKQAIKELQIVQEGGNPLRAGWGRLSARANSLRANESFSRRNIKMLQDVKYSAHVNDNKHGRDAAAYI